MEDVSESDPREVNAAKHNLNYIGMDGNIGCLGKWQEAPLRGPGVAAQCGRDRTVEGRERRNRHSLTVHSDRTVYLYTYYIRRM